MMWRNFKNINSLEKIQKMEPENDNIVYFKTREAHVFKAMLEFFHAALRNLVFTISKSGIRMRADNYKDDMNKESVLVDLHLPRWSTRGEHLVDEGLLRHPAARTRRVGEG